MLTIVNKYGHLLTTFKKLTFEYFNQYFTFTVGNSKSFFRYPTEQERMTIFFLREIIIIIFNSKN
jgi:hypothetical protein